MKTIKTIVQNQYDERTIKNLVRNMGFITIKLPIEEMRKTHLYDIRIIYGKYYKVTKWHYFYITLKPMSKLSEMLLRFWIYIQTK